MNLHEHQDDFKDLITFTSYQLKLPIHFVEKDYWIVFILRQLVQSEYADKFIFKGGTALAKAYKIIERFSEDVDLAVALEGATGNQQKKIIDTTSKAMTKGLEEVYRKDITSKGSRFRRTAHDYPKFFSKIENDQTKDDIIIEINSFIQPKDFTKLPIKTYIADFLLRTQKEDVIEEYGLESFEIQVLSLKRTFTEKLLSLVRASYMDKPVFELQERVRHFYDLHMLMQNETVKSFFNSDEFKVYLLQTKQDDASNKEFYGSWVEKLLIEAPIFSDFDILWLELEKTYTTEFSPMVYTSLPQSKVILESFRKIISRISDVCL